MRYPFQKLLDDQGIQRMAAFGSGSPPSVVVALLASAFPRAHLACAVHPIAAGAPSAFACLS